MAARLLLDIRLAQAALAFSSRCSMKWRDETPDAELRPFVWVAETLWPLRSNDNMPEIQTIGVIGGGTMGNGIAHTAARSGLKVILHDVEQRLLDRALSTITKNLDREVAKDKISADDKFSSLSRITP